MKKCPFGQDPQLGFTVIEHGNIVERFLIIKTRFDTNCPLCDRRNEALGIQKGCYRTLQVHTPEPGICQQCRVRDTVFQFLQPCIDIASKLNDLDVGTQGADEGSTPERRRSDHSPLRQVVERPGNRTDEGVAGVFARQKSSKAQTVRQHGRHVLGGVHRQIDRLVEKSLFDFLSEQTFAADLRKRPIPDTIASRGDDDDFERVLGTVECLHQAPPGFAGLYQSKLAPPRPDPDRL